MTSPCLSCEITSGQRNIGDGFIYENEYFHAHQDVAYPVAGQVIVVAKRHFKLLTEMSSAEMAAFLPLVQQIRQQQLIVLGIEHVYYFYNEDTTHHFHLWMVPRYDWMSQFGKSVEAVRPALYHARDKMNSEAHRLAVTQAAQKLKYAMAMLSE